MTDFWVMSASALLPVTELPLNFPQDFLPDRAMLARLLAFAVAGGAGAKQEISSATGIPTGKSTGKVEPMIHYASGMGLVRASVDRGVWQLLATPFGAMVAAEDGFLNEPTTLWACHLLLCRRRDAMRPARGIADPWFRLFAEGGARLGQVFSRADFLSALSERHGEIGYLRSLAGLVIRTYLEPSCFAALDVLRSHGEPGDERYERLPAGQTTALFPAYALAAWCAWDALYPDDRQVPLDELLNRSRLLAILHWRSGDADDWIEWMVERGVIQRDRLTGHTMVLRLVDTRTLVTRLYDELI